MLGFVASREEAGVDAGMECLDASIHDLREARQLCYRVHRETRLAQRAMCAAGRVDVEAERGEAARELDEPGLVANAEERPPRQASTPTAGSPGGGSGVPRPGCARGASPQCRPPRPRRRPAGAPA